MPLTLITGPANAAKAGAVLSRFRTALDRAGSARLPAPEPLLVVPTGADVEPFQRELAEAGLVFGGDVTTFGSLLADIGRRAGWRGRSLGRLARERVVAAVVADALAGVAPAAAGGRAATAGAGEAPGGGTGTGGGDVPGGGRAPGTGRPLRLRVLARSAATPGFAVAAGRLFAELQAAHVEPARFTAGLRRWAIEHAPSRAAYADEVAGLYAAYRARLEALGRVDAEGRAWAILDALRADPEAWGGRPVFLYGFDDLTAAQSDTVETLVRVCGAPVTLSLTFEAGRAAFADRAAAVETLRPLADELLELPERADHYAPASRPALHHLERQLFDAGTAPIPPNGTVRLLEAGGERAEAELIAATLLELTGDGVSPGDVAVLTGGAEQGGLLAQVLADHGLAVDRAVRLPLQRTRLGAGLLGFARSALPGGTAADLLAWLRTPGKVAEPAAADAAERAIRRLGVRTAAEALRLADLERLDPRARAVFVQAAAALAPLQAALAAADGRSPQGARSVDLGRPATGSDGTSPQAARSVDLGRPATGSDGTSGGDAGAVDAGAPLEAATQGVLDALLAELDAIWVAPYARRGAVLGATGTEDAKVAAEVRRAAKDLVGLARMDPALAGDGPALVEALAGLEIRLGGADPLRPAITVADPLDVRARRFRVVVVCGLQDEVFPRRAHAEPFLDDDDRRALARASGIVLGLHEDALAAERYRFYAAVSRAQEALLLAFRATDEDGEPQLRSPFVDDVLDLFTPELWEQRGRRLLAEVTWPPAQAPTPLELRRAQAVARGADAPTAQPHEPQPIHSPVVAARQAARATTGAGDLEAFAACGVRFLVERVLRPERIDPDPEPLRRGSRAHDVLERTLTLLRERTGSARLTPDREDVAREALRDALAEEARGVVRAQDRADLLALEADLGRWLRQECEHGPGYEPRALEWSFGGPEDEHGPLDLGAVKVTGRVDRVDVGPAGEAVVRDYKSSRGFPLAKWEPEGRMQAALYAVAVRELLGLDPAAALYQPLRGRDLRARGAARQGAAAAGLVGSDVVDPGEWEAVLQTMTDEARAAAERLRAGELRPCPERCTSRGCAYPAICRAPGSEPAPVEPA